MRMTINPTAMPVELPVPIRGRRKPMLWKFPEVSGPGSAARDILVATPPGYQPDSPERLPVVYLQDGQNLFDPATSFAGHWKLLETMARRGGRYPAIVVGIPNRGPGRLKEYSPFDDAVRGVGEGLGYLTWLTGVVKPLVDAAFNTRPERESTAVGGSSMGGLFSLFALLAARETFGAAWVMSPALWYADGAIFRWLRRQPAPVGRIWLDVGLREGSEERFDVRRMRNLLIARGWRLGRDLQYLEDRRGDHNEASWARRVNRNWRTLVGMMEQQTTATVPIP